MFRSKTHTCFLVPTPFATHNPYEKDCVSSLALCSYAPEVTEGSGSFCIVTFRPHLHASVMPLRTTVECELNLYGDLPTAYRTLAMTLLRWIAAPPHSALTNPQRLGGSRTPKK